MGKESPHAMVRPIPMVVAESEVAVIRFPPMALQALGIGVETADMLVTEVFSRQFRDRKAVARYAGLTGFPDESGKRRRERGLARAGNESFNSDS